MSSSRAPPLAGAALAFPTIVPSTVLGRNAPSNRITMGLIGMGLMMGSHHHIMLGRDEVQVLAVCDVDRGKRERAKAQTEKAYGAKQASGTYKGCDAYNEYERIIERKDIDAVIVVTPDHWHAMISLAAMKSGKDVYVQKPMTLTIREGRLMSDAAKQYGAILQVGSQQRSERAFRKACEIVRNGWIGKVHTIYTQLGEFPPAADAARGAHPRRLRLRPLAGPDAVVSVQQEARRGRTTAAAGAASGNTARARTATGARTTSTSSNGRWAWTIPARSSSCPKGYEGAEYQSHVYADGTKVWKNHPVKNGQMIQFIGDKGEVLVSRGDRLETTPAGLKDRPLAPGDIHLYESHNHEGNWLECIKTRKQPICPAEIGHRTATICHLNGIAERLNRPIKWDPVKEEIIGDAAASRWLDRPRRTPYVM